MSELGVSEARWLPLWDKLERLYSERGRYYHNLKHIAKTLALLDRFSGGSASALLRLAAFYHDAIYDVKATDNEERSAVMAKEDLLALGLPELLADDVADLIRAAKGHRPLWSSGERLASFPGRRPGDSRVCTERIRSLCG